MPGSDRADRVLALAGVDPETPATTSNGQHPPSTRLIGAWPVLDPVALHGLAGEIVAAIEPHTEADPAGLLVTLLVEFGALIGPGPHALADSAQHPARLFAVLVGETAKGRKGTIEANVRRVTGGVDLAFTMDRRLNGFGSGEALIDAVRGETENNDRRLLVVEPEFARILNVARRDGSTLSTAIRQAWDGGRLAVRSRAGTTVVDDSHVCVVGHISADELRAKLTETEVAGGFANRFLFACVRRSKLLPSGGNLDDATLGPFVRKYALFATQARTVGIVHRTPAAEALWTDLYHEMAADEPGGLLAAVIARDSAQTLRLSVAYALLDGSRKIDVEHVRAAWGLWSYCRNSAAFVFGESLGNPVADQLLRAAREAGTAGIDGRQRNALFGGHASKDQIEAACALLFAKRLAFMETIETGGRPGTVLRATECEQSEQRGLEGQREKSLTSTARDPDCGQSGQSGQSPLSDDCEQSGQSPEAVDGSDGAWLSTDAADDGRYGPDDDEDDWLPLGDDLSAAHAEDGAL
jgi:hypothetical protein